MPLVTETHVTNQLRQIRVSQGLAAYGLAVRAKVSPTIIGAIERWDYMPGAPVRQRLADALGVDEIQIWPRSHEAPCAAE
jgi:ribosome-binding protein aMBF1 (putative translation factor)